MQPKQPDFEKIVDLMASANAEVVIIGLAMTLRGSDYVTTDVDFAYRRTRENAARIADALAELQPRPEGWDAATPFVWDELSNIRVRTLQSELDVLIRI